RGVGVRGIAGGNDYLHTANKNTVSFAMIETREALAVVDDILAVDGIDGVFVGPADFSIAWTGGAALNPQLDDMMGAVADIAAKAKARGKHAGIFAMNPADTPKYKAMGYRFIAVGFDTGVVAKGAQAILAAAKGEADTSAIKGGY
ncbi:MAG: aldolase/citrate lyase family protein, partial [Ahrensia sp.]